MLLLAIVHACRRRSSFFFVRWFICVNARTKISTTKTTNLTKNIDKTRHKESEWKRERKVAILVLVVVVVVEGVYLTLHSSKSNTNWIFYTNIQI